jgi:hypothetical protein
VTATDGYGMAAADRAALIEAVKVALSRACRNEHTINKRDEDNGSVTFWITCSDQQLSSINLPENAEAPELQIAHWKSRVMDDHRWSLAPEVAVDAMLATQQKTACAAEGSDG